LRDLPGELLSGPATVALDAPNLTSIDFDLQASDADGPARKLGNLNLLVSDVIEFQNDRIAFAAVDARVRF
jgi:hypothetical protein